MTSRREQVLRELTRYIADDVLKDASSGLEPTSPLLEWGVLNSMNLMNLLTHIHSRYGAAVSPVELVGNNFKDLNAITDLVMSKLPAASAEQVGR